MDDEHCFSIMTFIKNVEKLPLLSFGFVQKNYTQFFYTIENFLLEEAIIH
jgi:hypothetical protein